MAIEGSADRVRDPATQETDELTHVLTSLFRDQTRSIARVLGWFLAGFDVARVHCSVGLGGLSAVEELLEGGLQIVSSVSSGFGAAP